MTEADLDFVHHICHYLSYKKCTEELTYKLENYYKDFSYEMMDCIYTALFDRKEKFYWWADFREHYYKMQKLQGDTNE